jgi:hypothetical protein
LIFAQVGLDCDPPTSHFLLSLRWQVPPHIAFFH